MKITKNLNKNNQLWDEILTRDLPNTNTDLPELLSLMMLWITQLTYWILISLVYISHEDHYCSQQVSAEATLKSLLRETYVYRFSRHPEVLCSFRQLPLVKYRDRIFNRPRLSRWYSPFHYQLFDSTSHAEGYTKLFAVALNTSFTRKCNWSYRCPIIILGRAWLNG
jgi:hypothetical protein